MRANGSKLLKFLMAGLWAWAASSMLSACGGAKDDDSVVRRSAAQTATGLVADAGYPGAVAVQVGGDTVEVAAAGVLRVGGAAATPNDRFPVGSLTKSMTATLAAVLLQEGRIGWDSLLLDVLPELASRSRTDYRGVTLRNLLSHRSGLFEAATAEALAQVPELVGTPAEQRLQFTAWALGLAPAVKPGQQSRYSNGGYVAAGAMLERAGGAPYETLIQQRLFQPLGIAPTFGAAGAAPAPEAWGHTSAGVRRWSALDPSSAEALFPAAANPAGGAKLSGNELARYLQLHVKALRGDGGLLITPGNARIVHTAVQDGLALGWIDGADERRRPLSWHNGSDDLSYYGLMAMRMDAHGAAAVLVNAFGNAIETDINNATLFLLP